MKTGLITSDTYQNHNTGDGHPEKIDRVTVVIDNFLKLSITTVTLSIFSGWPSPVL